MGILSWFTGASKSKPQKPEPPKSGNSKSETLGMNGAMEVLRPPPEGVTVFEFGSVAASADKVTMAGYCPVSDDLQPCRWEILPSPSPDTDGPQFRVVF